MENKGTIIYFGCFEMPDRNASAHRVLNNAKILNCLGYKVCFCGIDKQIQNIAEAPCMMSEFLSSWPKPYPRNGKEWFLDLTDFDFYKKCINYFDDVKYVICFDPHALPLKRLISYCKSKNIQLVADVSEWYENHFGVTPGKFFRWLDTELVMRRYLKKVANIIAISSFIENYYNSFAKQIIVVPPLVDIEESIWQQPRIKADEIVNFVYAGTTDRYKDKLDLIVNAFYSLISLPFHLDIYGLTKEDFDRIYPEKKAIAEELGNKIKFNGFVSHNACVTSLLNSDCTLIIRDSTRKNNAGFPTKYVEAVTTGIKIIVSDISDIRNYLNTCPNTKLLSSNSQDEIETTITKIIEEGKTEHINLGTTFDYHSFIDIFAKMFKE